MGSVGAVFNSPPPSILNRRGFRGVSPRRENNGGRSAIEGGHTDRRAAIREIEDGNAPLVMVIYSVFLSHRGHWGFRGFCLPELPTTMRGGGGNEAVVPCGVLH